MKGSKEHLFNMTIQNVLISVSKPPFQITKQQLNISHGVKSEHVNVSNTGGIDTPQVKPDEYLFHFSLFNCCSVLKKKGLTPKILTFCVAILDKRFF